MKRIIPSIIALGAALTFFALSGGRDKSASSNAPEAVVSSSIESVVAGSSRQEVQSRPPAKALEEINGKLHVHPEALLATRADLRWNAPVEHPKFEAFRSWTHRYLSAPAQDKTVLEAEGVVLAAERRSALMELIPQNPELAFERAVPVTVWRQMPVGVRANLETRVDTKGDVLVEARRPMPGKVVESTVVHANLGGTNIRAYGEGRTTTKIGVPLTGIQLAAADLPGKPIVALSQMAGRVLEPVEVADAKAQMGEEPVCETSGQPASVNSSEIALNIGGTSEFFCGVAHAGAELEGVTRSSLEAKGYNSTGTRKLLIYRVDFPDYQGQRVDEATLNNLIGSMKTFWEDMSYGVFSWAAVGATGSRVTPVLRLPQNADSYTDLGTFLSACRTAARAAGIEPNGFDFDMVVTAAKPTASFGGVGYVGWKGCWLANSQWNLSVGSHELGHNVSLNHSNYWDVSGSNPIDPDGTSVEYGDSFDIMGTGGNDTRRHFNVREKNLLDWAPNSSIHTAAAIGTYRIYAMDRKATGTGNLKRGIKIDRLNSGNDWWIDYRQLYAASNTNAKNGVWLHWGGTGNQKTNLIDMVPGGGKDDSPLVIGKTFTDSSDPANPIYITPLARGNVDPDWVDIRIVQGGGTNKTPSVTLSATNVVPNANVNTTITATGTDPDGDTLTYFWDMGDGATITNNTSTITYKYPANGNRTVRCTVSDGRGGSATGSIVIRVGGQTIFTIQGSVRNVSGNPIEGVTVSAGGNRTDVTDNSGNYVITNLPAGNYTLTASKPTLTVNLASGVTNPVSVGPDRTNINFTVAPGAPFLGTMLSAIADSGSNTGDITLPLTDPDTPLGNITFTATSSNTAIIPNANIVFGTRGSARTVRANAPANRTGNVTITITARDPQNNQTTTTWPVIVNNNPTMAGTTLTTTQDAPVSIDLRTLATDDLAANTALSFQVSRVIGGTAEVLPDGFTARFTPTPGYQGSGSFRVTARDQSLSSRLVALYDFEPPDVTTDGKATDQGNYHADATLDAVGTTEINYRPEVPSQLRPFSTQSVSFSDNGLDSAARLLRKFSPNDIDFSNSTSGWSFSAWVNRRSNMSDDFIFHLGEGDGFGTESGESGTANELQLYFPAGENRLLLAKYGAGGLENGFTANNVGVNEWHHVAVTCTIPSAGIGIFSLYLDGFLVGTTTATPIAFDQNAPVAFGGHGADTKPGRWLDGWLDDISLYSNVLPHADVAGLSTFGTRHYLGQAAIATINVTINGANDAPAIQPIANRRVPGGSGADSVGVMVSDAETPARDLIVTATSSNPALVPNNSSNLFLLPTSAWTSTDVGAVGAAGSTTEAAGTLVVRGSGAQMDSTADEFRFVHLPMSDDGEVVARVVSMDYTHEKGRSGIMFRAGNQSNAPFAFVGIGPGASAVFHARNTTGLVPSAIGEAARLPMPRWLKLVRSGNSVSAFHAADNAGVRGEWLPLGTTTLTGLPSTVNAGLVVNSYVDATLATTLFDNVSGDIPNGAKRKLVVVPVAGVPGSTTITVTVSDGSLTSSTAFDFSTNTAPTIGHVPDFGLEQGTFSEPIPVFVGDDESGAGDVILSAVSSNQSIIATGDISVAGSGAERAVTLRAKPGVKGLVEITLTANDGQLSSSKKFRVFVAPAGTMVVNVAGFGAVSGYFGESLVPPGKLVTVSAKPVAGQAFAGWRGVIASYDPKLTFTMPSVMYLEATFQNTPYPRLVGTWNGLVLDEPRTHGGAGSILIKVTPAGGYTGRLTYGGASYSFRGILNTDGTASNAVILRKNLPSLGLNFAWNGTTHVIEGTVSNDGEASVMVAHHALYTTSSRPTGAQRRLPAALLGKVTGLFDADPVAGPVGSGYASGTVSGSGSVKLVGRFADGTPFTASNYLSLTGDFPFHVVLYKGLGSATGWLVWRTLPETDFTGSVTTFRPANPLDSTFSTGWPDGATLSVAGSYYVQPRAARLSFPAVLPLPELPADTVDGNALITLDGATYIDEQRALHISPLGKIEPGPLAVDESLSLSLKASTGLLSGSSNHGGKSIKFSGALLQKANRGGGYTLTPGAAGVFMLEPAR